MYITYISPTIDIKEYPQKNSKECYFCQSNNQLFPSYYDNNIIDTCYLCNIIINYKKEYIFYGFLGYTEMTQLEIIKKTWEIYNKEGNIPLPIEIDPDVKLVKIPIYLFSQFFDKYKFPYYCLFFTNKIENIMEDEITAAFNPSSGNKINILKYLDIPENKLSEKENKKVEKQISYIKEKDFKIMIEKQAILRERINKI